MGWLASALKSIASLLGMAERRQADNNSPEMKKRAIKQKEVEADSKTAAAIERRDTDALRREGSE